MTDSFKARTTLTVGSRNYDILSLAALEAHGSGRLPFALKILLENLLRFEDGINVTKSDIEALLHWDPKALPRHEIAFTPARVIMQDFTGVPCIVDLAAMREAIVRLGGDPQRVNPLAPAELVIDHSVQVDEYGTADSLKHNNEIEFARNGERYSFLRWGQTAFSNFNVVPPNTGIVHQVNIERLARVVFADATGGKPVAYPDTLVGTDSHTTMVNGLGVLGWGVGGIEAEAAMLGQPVTMLIPQVIGFKLSGSLPPQEGRRRQVRRVLRRRPLGAAAGRSRDDREHVAGIRLHLRDLPDRRGNHPLSAADRPPRRPDRAGRGLRAGPGSVAHRWRRGGGVHRCRRTRPVDRRTLPGGT
jgi:aconitate hydratase